MSKQTEITIEEKRIISFLFKKIVVRKIPLFYYINSNIFLDCVCVFCFSVVNSDGFSTLTKPKNHH